MEPAAKAETEQKKLSGSREKRGLARGESPVYRSAAEGKTPKEKTN